MKGAALTEGELARFSEFVKTRIGLLFPPGKYDDLRRGIAMISDEQGFDDPSACLSWILSTPLDRTLVEMLASALTIGETYFFRDSKVFEVIEHSLLPAVISRRREQGRFIRLWSAACSTGEEAYSLAILLSRMVPDMKNWSVTILATDINANALKKAEAGIYSEWSFRTTPQQVKDRYFKKLSNGRYEIISDIKNLVTFSYLNLVEDDYPALLTNTNAMDLILCRNVLMYFSKESVLATTEKLRRSLVTGGSLIVSATETHLVAYHDLLPESPGGVTLYRKVDAAMPDVLPAIHEFYEPVPIRQVPVTPWVVSFPAEEKGTREEVLEELRPFKMPVPESLPTPPAQPVTKTDAYDAAVRLFESGDYLGSEKILGTYITKNPGDHKAMALMTQVLANRGDLTGARGWCEKAIALDKLNPFYHHLMATIRQEEGDFDAAAGELRRALYADPSYIPAHFTLAHLKRRQGKIEESDMYFRNVRDLLRRFQSDEIIAGTEGMSAGSLEQNIRSMIGEEVTV